MSNHTGTDVPRCQWCNSFHAMKCPLVKAIEYHENGLTKRVEFFAAVDFPPSAAPILR